MFSIYDRKDQEGQAQKDAPSSRPPGSGAAAMAGEQSSVRIAVLQELKHSLVSRQRKANGRDVKDIWKFFPEHGHRRCCCNKPNTNALVHSVTPLSFCNIKRPALGGSLFNRSPSRDAPSPRDTVKVTVSEQTRGNPAQGGCATQLPTPGRLMTEERDGQPAG